MSLTLFDLTGKRALITGVASERSIAWGIAQAMAREGASLAFTYQSERLGERVREMAAETGSAICLPLDVASDDEIRRVAKKLLAENHPDRNPNNPAAEDRYKEVGEARDDRRDLLGSARPVLFGEEATLRHREVAHGVVVRHGADDKRLAQAAGAADL